MGKNFGPLFIIVPALGAAAIWTQTPRFVTALPEGLRAAFRSYVRQAQGLGDLGEQVAAQTEGKDKPVQLLGGTTAPATDTPVAGTVPAATPPPAATPAPGASPIAAKPPAPPEAPRAPFASPADNKGVKVVNTSSADWGVLMRSTPIQALDEKPLGTASGGRFFVIERRARSGGGKVFIGNFTPKRLSQPVQIDSRHALSLSGSPDDLSTAQLHALKMYYQLRGEAIDYLDEVRRTKGDCASPLYKKLVEAERIRDFRDKELKQMSGLKGDQRAVELEELEKLKRKAADLRAQHEDWKRAHAAQIADPTRDPHYQGLVREYRRYAGDLPAGLAVE
jgi:hypothetical protein